MTKKQKFKRGDMVRISNNLGSSMKHFECIIIGSYRDKFGGNNNTKDYTVILCETGNEVAWYKEHQLTYIKHVGEAGIETIELARSRRESQESDLDWIVSNWIGIRQNPSGATVGKLMELVGIRNPWGARGEGITYYSNMLYTLKLLNPVLETGDTQKLKDFCKEIRSRMDVV